jgi:hypothetical protein
MRNGQKYKLLLKIPTSKSYPQASKRLVYIVFRFNKRSKTSPEDLSFFWDQIPLQMAKISSKKPILAQKSPITGINQLKN